MKYELTCDTKVFGNTVLHRIKAIKDFADVKKDDLGGWVESENNLSQEGNCWVYDNAVAFQQAVVMDNAKIKNNVIVSGNAEIRDFALVTDDVRIFDNVQVYGSAKVKDNVFVLNNAKIYGNAEVCDNTVIRQEAKVFENAMVGGYADIYGEAEVRGNTYILDTISIFDKAVIKDNQDWFMVGLVGEDETATFFKTKDDEIVVNWGEEFYGTVEELKTKINEVAHNEREAKKIDLSIQLAQIHINV